MAFNLTIGEAAEKLGVTRGRIYQLVNNGSLEAEKVGGIWLVDDVSIMNRLSSSPSAGRPRPSKSSETAQSYILMNRQYPVLEFKFDEGKNAFGDSCEIFDAQRAPLGLISKRGTVSSSALGFWWKHRSIPKTREGISEKLRELGVSSPDLVPFKNLGFSLSDQYWIKPLHSETPNDALLWEKLNFFNNDFAAMNPNRDWMDGVGLNSPDNTSEGELPKTWFCKNGSRFLAKGGGTLNQEPFNEVVATALHARLLKNEDYVPYALETLNREVVCTCPLFLCDDEEYIPAYYVMQTARKANHHSEYQHYIECCSQLGVNGIEEQLDKMIVCDDILGNFDRHFRNFGIIRNVNTLECRPAPLFDSGNSLWCNKATATLAAGNLSFSTKPFYEDANRQLRLANDYSWFNPSALDGFIDEAMAILKGNPALYDRLEYIAEGMRQRIQRIALWI